MTTSGQSISIGLHVSFCNSLPDKLKEFVYDGDFRFLMTPLVHPRFQRDSGELCNNRTTPLTRSDMLLTSSEWGRGIIGEISKWIDTDSSDVHIRRNAEFVLNQELMWASHLSVGAVVLPCPGAVSYNYANCINAHINRSSNFWVRVPLGKDGESLLLWQRFRELCNRSSCLKVLLELAETLPDSCVLAQWIAEPVRGVLIPTSIFLSNSKGFPVLSVAHQELVVRLHKRDIQFVLSGAARHPSGYRVYYLYLQHLISRLPEKSEKEEFESPYYDCLQTPLQPLGDHLESQMYETFEKDPVKYAKYEQAITRALMDTPVGKKSVIMVVGAGRGPLVRCALRAAEKAKRNIKIYAVEKNPNAIITLRNMHAMLLWGDNVSIVHSDMRSWVAPELADILVSELLGSWGDNELSPECLDGAEKFLKRDGGISIPYEYTSFVCPISTPKLWNDCRSMELAKYMETMYVVYLHNFYEYAPSTPCFTFAHPSWKKRVDPRTGDDTFDDDAVHHDGNIDINNSRFKVLEFEIQTSGMCHGFAGYFEAKLYKEVMISINPKTFSTGMFSWFPIYIPVQRPFAVKRGDKIRVMFWRKCQTTKVWYEWALDAPTISCIHNTNGTSQSINLSIE